VVFVGLLMVVVGFALVAPRGATPGGASHRNVVLGPGPIGQGRLTRTPGYQDDPGRRWLVARIVIGIALMVGGVLVIMSAS
jgi:hypothetical protein